LYDLVWSKPMSQLCREYGLSDVGLAKICKKHEVPYPPRGYWTKVRNGQRVQKPPLRPVTNPALQPVEIPKRPLSEIDKAAREAARSTVEADNGPGERIPVADVLTDPHPLVERTVRSLNSARPGKDGLVQPKAAHCLAVRVAPNSIDRSARLLDALIKALEAKGFAVSADEGETAKTWVALLGEKLSLRLEETVERQEKVQSFFNHRHDYDLVPTGRLTLRIDDALGGGNRRQWSDGKKSLDGQLHAVVGGLVKTAEVTKAIRAENARREKERQEDERRRQEHERRRREEEARVIDFDRKLAGWEQAKRIRRFVAAVRDNAIRCAGVIVPGSEQDRWLAWAWRRADRLDPLLAARAEDRWPPTQGLKVKTSDPRGYGWSQYDFGETAIVPPDLPGSNQGTPIAPTALNPSTPSSGAPGS
jgi:hypothetical protein